MEETGKELFEAFAAELGEWAKTGKTPVSGNQDIRYGLELQKARLEKHHASMVFNLALRGEWMDRIYDHVFSDTKYTNRLLSRSYRKTADYYLDGQKRLSDADDVDLFSIVTWLNQGEIQETCCCPNCGAISKVETLLEGCPYCRTRFLMSDLFPKVTSYHFLWDCSMNEKESKDWIRKVMLTGAVIGMLYVTPRSLWSLLPFGSEKAGFFSVIFSFIPAGIFGALAGYAVGAFLKIGKVFREGVRQAPMAVSQLNAKKRLTELMKPYDSGFSYEYFIGIVQGLIKILIYTDERSNLAVYEGPPVGNLFDNIIDAQFGGALGVTDCRIAGDYCYLHLNVYMTDVYCMNSKIFKRNDLFQMGLCRNIRKPVDYGFSIKKVACKSCGGSFDASREKHCPYCGTVYELKEDDWVITYIKKR